MFIDDIRASENHISRMPEMHGYFEVSSAYAALPELGWQEWVRRLLDTTPARPPYPLSWWEFVDRTQGEAIRHGISVDHRSFDDWIRIQMRIDARAGLSGQSEVAVEEMRERGTVSVIAGTMAIGMRGHHKWIARIMVALDERDMAIPREDGYLHLFQPLNLAFADQGGGLALTNTAWQLAYYMALTHVRNVGTEDHAPDERLQRARIRRGKPPLVTYKTLHITPMGQRSASGERGPVQGVMPLHIVRGNFAHYSEDAPLFGRYSGTFWRPAHVKGNPEHGAVVKDYAVDVDAVSV